MKHSRNLFIATGILFALAACGGNAASNTPLPNDPLLVASPDDIRPTTQPTPIPAPTIQPSPTALPGQIVDEHGIRMLLIPAGEFLMGSEDGIHDEAPIHTVYLDAFYMDIYEVTNAAYAACVADGGCSLPRKTSGYYRIEYYGNPEYDSYPVVNISWTDADTYCRWRGARLPTEAEWEKAARGSEDHRTYAWGDEWPNPELTNYGGSGIWETTPVGAYPAGVSPYGIHDMSGNVYEWVADWYAEDYYANSPYENPTGPADGAWKVTRGGSFYNTPEVPPNRLRISNRNNTYLPPESIHWDGGARCARDP